jgi:hypothetical protein
MLCVGLIAASVALSACGGADDDDYQSEKPNRIIENSKSYFETLDRVTLQNDTYVMCITTKTDHTGSHGFSCDWVDYHNRYG